MLTGLTDFCEHKGYDQDGAAKSSVLAAEKFAENREYVASETDKILFLKELIFV